MASGLDINGCVLSYFEGTANSHCYTSVFCTLSSVQSVSIYCLYVFFFFALSGARSKEFHSPRHLCCGDVTIKVINNVINTNLI